MKKKLLFPILIFALLFALFGCSVEKVGETFEETERGVFLKRFVGTSEQTEYTVPDTYEGRPVVGLSQFAISNAEYLKTVRIGKNVVSIDPWAFSNCQKLERIEVAEDNPNFSSVDGVLFNKETTKLLVFPNMNAVDFAVPEGVTEIGENAFYKCGNLRTVALPGSLVKIGDRSFFRTDRLTPPPLPAGLAEIGVDAFAFTRSNSSDEFKKLDVATTIYLPASVLKIGAGAFFGSGLTEIRSGAKAADVTVGEKWLPIVSGSVWTEIDVVWEAEA